MNTEKQKKCVRGCSGLILTCLLSLPVFGGTVPSHPRDRSEIFLKKRAFIPDTVETMTIKNATDFFEELLHYRGRKCKLMNLIRESSILIKNKKIKMEIDDFAVIMHTMKFYYNNWKNNEKIIFRNFVKACLGYFEYSFSAIKQLIRIQHPSGSIIDTTENVCYIGNVLFRTDLPNKTKIEIEKYLQENDLEMIKKFGRSVYRKMIENILNKKRKKVLDIWLSQTNGCIPSDLNLLMRNYIALNSNNSIKYINKTDMSNSDSETDDDEGNTEAKIWKRIQARIESSQRRIQKKILDIWLREANIYLPNGSKQIILQYIPFKAPISLHRSAVNENSNNNYGLEGSDDDSDTDDSSNNENSSDDDWENQTD